ncbi:hypothetical protein ACWEQL_41715, partial [Kitasatospora sp. NPDC004240]
AASAVPAAAAFPRAAPPAAPPAPPVGFPGHATAQGGPRPPAGPPPVAPAHDPFPGHDGHPQDFPGGPGGPGGPPPYGQQPAGGPGYGAPDYASYENHQQYRQPEDEDRAGGNRRAPLLIGFALLFVLTLGGGILFALKDDGSEPAQAAPAPTVPANGGAANPQPAPQQPGGQSGTPSASATDTPSAGASASPSAGAAGPGAQTQAKALDELLTRGEGAKAPIGNAVAKVNSCPAKTDIEASAQVFDSGAKQRDQLLADLAKLSVADVPGGAEAVQSLTSAWQLSADIDRAYAAWARSVAEKGCSGTAPNTADKKRADELNPQATAAKKDFVAKWNAMAGTYGLNPRTQDRI